jgi:hypothetical protein
MKNKLFTMFVAVTVLLSIFVGSASAQAYAANFTTSITYVNVGTDITQTLDLLFYANPDTTDPTSHSLTPLAAGAADSLYVGSLGNDIVPAGFQGDAVMQSDQPMLVTLVQIPSGVPGVSNRALSNGFGAGGPSTKIATVLKNMFHYNSIFSVQNADSEDNIITLTFYDTAAQVVFTDTQTLSPGAPYYFDAGLSTDLPDPFNGSAIIEATRVGGGAGSIVSSDMELQVDGPGLYAFEGVAAGTMQFYMPSALCQYVIPTGVTDTSYAVQNTSLITDTNVTVTYHDTVGGVYSETKTIGPGAKASFAGCAAMVHGTIGSAVVTSDSQDVIAIGKAFGGGLSTAFNGVPLGYQNIALPYVRWADDAHWNAGTHQRTYITIQNVGADLLEGAVITIDYNDPTGATVGTHTYTVPAGGLANGAKFNSTAPNAGLTSFGYWENYTKAGGAAIIHGPAGAELTAVARVGTLSGGVQVSEDYNSQALP